MKPEGMKNDYDKIAEEVEEIAGIIHNCEYALRKKVFFGVDLVPHALESAKRRLYDLKDWAVCRAGIRRELAKKVTEADSDNYLK